MLNLAAVAALALSSSPSSALNSWRTSRLHTWCRVLEKRYSVSYSAFNKVREDLRYRTQILVVDDGDGTRSRVVESVLDQLLSGDLDGPDIDVMSSTISSQPAAPLTDELRELGAELGMPFYPSARRSVRPSDLTFPNSRFDLVVCTEPSTLAAPTHPLRTSGSLARRCES